ncbi:MAG TPA: 2,3-bisphosphoglycerate-independent phosphoglycerate mutase, partial [Patescibacteria group bacterium]|nr:2,3-bisphosphoglycerate-independent phosphoglycerate mutase [Patescibacteria group bacterium]
MQRYRPVVLIILDGWGVAPDGEGNAITRSNLPNFQKLLKSYPTMTVQASGAEVGLMFGEMGSSEVGHLNIGAGRVYYQTLPRINKEIAEGAFQTRPAFLSAFEHVKKNNSKLHLMGLAGNGSVHATSEHLYALLGMCRVNGLSNNVFIHAFLD